MERIKALIDKLYQQKENGQTPAQLLLTVQLLQSELLHLQQRNDAPARSKVAVTMPVNLNFSEEVLRTRPSDPPRESRDDAPYLPKVEKPYGVEPVEPEIEMPVPEPEPLKQAEYFLRKPVVGSGQQEVSRPAATQANFFNAFDTLEEAPTLVQHQPGKEINELIADQKESLNDRLKQAKKEVVHILKETPIKDLRKGIGINDRFTFVSELFRGDDAMYERSIKTINGFGILSEAEYWINRELKFKLGWNDNKEVVQHFYHLVRRRFS
ncbi:MAG: hypothetical protein ACXVMS_05250 [Flavisolibacter sp.]